MSPYENMETFETERAALRAGAWKAWADSRSARATTAADFICKEFCEAKGTGAVRRRWPACSAVRRAAARPGASARQRAGRASAQRA